MEEGAMAWAEGLALDNVFTIVICSLLLRMYYTSQVLALYLLKNIILASLQP